MKAPSFLKTSSSHKEIVLYYFLIRATSNISLHSQDSEKYHNIATFYTSDLLISRLSSQRMLLLTQRDVLNANYGARNSSSGWAHQCYIFSSHNVGRSLCWGKKLCKNIGQNPNNRETNSVSLREIPICFSHATTPHASWQTSTDWGIFKSSQW